jgi:curved DNA-binding protein CbpA
MKKPHEILGVAQDASINDVTKAFNRLAPRCNPASHPGNDIMAERFRQLRAAYEAMVKQRQDEEARKPAPRSTAYNYRVDPEADQFIFREPPPKSKKKVAEDALALRIRIGRLLARWNGYVVDVHNRNKTVDAIKSERGLNFTYLKHVFRRTSEDHSLWAAEDYLRRGYEDSAGMHYSYRSLAAVIGDLRYKMRHNELQDVNSGILELAEEDLSYRIMMRRQAVQLLEGKVPTPRP